jgi:hypothetical protein
MGARGASELCTLIEARAAEFNAVNTAHGLWALAAQLGVPRGGVTRQGVVLTDFQPLVDCQ